VFFITTTTLVGHSYVGKLTPNEMSKLVDMTKSLVNLRNFLLILKKNNKKDVTITK